MIDEEELDETHFKKWKLKLQKIVKVITVIGNGHAYTVPVSLPKVHFLERPLEEE